MNHCINTQQEPAAKKQKSILDDVNEVGRAPNVPNSDVVIESGPVEYATEDQDIEDEDEYDDDGQLSTAQILVDDQEEFGGVYT